MWTPKDLAAQIDPLLQQFRGMIRRAAVSLARSTARWQVSGFRQADGSTETKTAEVFSGIGFFSRPPSSGTPEAIVNMVGADARTPVVVATRDEKTRAAVIGGLALPPPGGGGGVLGGGPPPTSTPTELGEDETIVFTSKAIVYIKSDGTVQIRALGGQPQPLALNADLAALINILSTWTPAPGDGGAALKLAINTYLGANPTWPAGTQVLEAE